MKSFLRVVIVEGGGLLGEQLDGALGEVEIGRDQAELLQGQLLGADLLRLGNLLHPLVQEVVDLFLGDEVAGNGVMQLHPGDLGELDGDAIGLAAEFLRARIGLRGAAAPAEQQQKSRRVAGYAAIGLLRWLTPNATRREPSRGRCRSPP